MIWTKAFWSGAGERAVKTFFQTVVAVVGASALGVEFPGLGLIDWVDVASVSGLAAFLSVATSIGTADFTAGKPDISIKADSATVTVDATSDDQPQ